MLELLGDGLELAVFGMSVVFLLLGCLVVALGGMSRLAAAMEHPAGMDPQTEAELTVAIATAIHMHRRRREQVNR